MSDMWHGYGRDLVSSPLRLSQGEINVSFGPGSYLVALERKLFPSSSRWLEEFSFHGAGCCRGCSQILEAACISLHVVLSIFKQGVVCQILLVLHISPACPSAASQRKLSAFNKLL